MSRIPDSQGDATIVTWQKICAPSCCTVFTHWPHSAVICVSLPHRPSVPAFPSASGGNGTKMQRDETHEATLTSVTKQGDGDGTDAKALFDSIKSCFIKPTTPVFTLTDTCQKHRDGSRFTVVLQPSVRIWEERAKLEFCPMFA